jgi:hypothetical protein
MMQSKLVKVVKEQLDEIRMPADCTTWWRIFSINERTGIIKMMVSQPNIIPYQGADIMAQLLAGEATWKIGAMFFEFENTAGAPTVPSPQRSESIDYYIDDLSLEPTKDYMRIPLIVPPAVTSSSAVYAGNQVTFFAITSGLTGVHGRTFDASVNSKVYGVALAATPEPTEYTQDKLFSRSYTGFDPVPKEDGFAVGAMYLIRFA